MNFDKKVLNFSKSDLVGFLKRNDLKLIPLREIKTGDKVKLVPSEKIKGNNDIWTKEYTEVVQNKSYGIKTGLQDNSKTLIVIDIDGDNHSTSGFRRWHNFLSAFPMDKELKEELENFENTFSVLSASGKGVHLYYYISSMRMLEIFSDGKIYNSGAGIDLITGNNNTITAPLSLKGRNEYKVICDKDIMELPKELESLIIKDKKNQKNDFPVDWELSKIDDKLMGLYEIRNQGGFDDYTSWKGLGISLQNEGYTIGDWKSLSWEGGNPTDNDLESLWTSYDFPNNKYSIDRILIDNGFDTNVPEEYKHSKILTLDEHLEELHNQYCVVKMGDKLRIYEKRTGNLYDKTNFFDLEMKRVYIKYFKKTVKYFRATPIIFPMLSVFDGLTFRPDTTSVIVDNKVNLFKGYNVEPKKGNNHEDFKEFMFDIICNNNQELYDYLIKYIAHVVQKPLEKPAKALIFYSEKQGTGKSTFVDIIGEIFGNMFMRDDGAKAITGRFNSQLQGKMLVFLDELSNDNFANGSVKVIRDKFKNKISNSTKLSVERKGLETYEIESFARYIIATNEKNLNLVDKHDRRYMVFNVSDKRQNDTRYFVNLKKQMLKEEGLNNFLNELQNMNLEDFEVEISPKTEIHTTSMIETQNPIIQYLIDEVANENFDNTEYFADDFINKIRDEVNTKRSNKSIKTLLSNFFTAEEELNIRKNIMLKSGNRVKRRYYVIDYKILKKNIENYLGNHNIDWNSLKENILEVNEDDVYGLIA